MLTFDEYKTITEHIKQLVMLKARATDPKQKAYYTQKIKSLNERISRLLHEQ